MNDRELLELAAKAAGIVPPLPDEGCIDNDGGFSFYEDCEGKRWNTWNPMKNNSDALCLAVRLRMNIEVTDSETFACSFGNHAEKHGSDPMAATRRAIVRAAAEIGKRGA